MTLRIEDYAVIGDLHTAAIVGNNGSIDWLCLPHFDSPSCFARLLGDRTNGFWQLAPVGGADSIVATRRRYREDSLVLETEFETATGTVRVTDCMPMRDTHPHVVRLVEGISGTVDMHMDMAVRFDYGDIVPWLTSTDGLIRMTAGPDAVALWHRVDPIGHDLHTEADFTVPRRVTLSVHVRLVPLARRSAAAPRRVLRHQSHRCVLEGVVLALYVRGSLSRRGGALAHHAQGAHLRAHRWHRGCGHHLVARSDRGESQLGLPLLLVARCHVDVGVPHARGILR